MCTSNDTEMANMLEVFQSQLALFTGTHRKVWLKAFKRLMTGRIPFWHTEEDVWLKISQGSFDTELLIEEVSSDLICLVTERAKELLRRYHTSGKFSDVGYVKGDVVELFGNPKLTNPVDFLNARFLARYGLEPCLPEDAFYIDPHYPRNDGEGACVGTVPLEEASGETHILCLGSYTEGHQYYGRRSIISTKVHDGCMWIGPKWIFRHKTS